MIKPYVDSTQILVLSPASTAPSLAVADNIYRLVPDDTNQGRIISILLTEDNITTVFLLVRDDVWGNDLADAIKEFYAGKISQINYNPDESLFEEKLQELSDLVTAEPTKENVAIISIGAGETVEIMLHATNYDVLDDVKWFGTDANANEEKILENDLTSTFAQDVSFTTVQFASDRTNPDNRNLESRLFIELEYLPNTYAFAAYDAVWLVGLSMLDTNSTDPNIIKSAIPDVVQSYNGMLGDLDFNEAGDLDSDNYDIWYVKDGQWYNEPRQ